MERRRFSFGILRSGLANGCPSLGTGFLPSMHNFGISVDGDRDLARRKRFIMFTPGVEQGKGTIRPYYSQCTRGIVKQTGISIGTLLVVSIWHVSHNRGLRPEEGLHVQIASWFWSEVEASSAGECVH